MNAIDKDAIGASIGIAGMLVCCAIVFGTSVWTRLAPVVREYLLTNAGAILVGMVAGASIAVAAWLCMRGERP